LSANRSEQTTNRVRLCRTCGGIANQFGQYAWVADEVIAPD
jgi:hypothetical protein